jgi:hypothetical protein
VARLHYKERWMSYLLADPPTLQGALDVLLFAR